MFGPQKDVAGECNARLTIADDYGDNHATVRCQKEPGHAGKHREMYGSRLAGTISIEWERDERIPPGEPVTVDDLMKPIENVDDEEDEAPEELLLRVTG